MNPMNPYGPPGGGPPGGYPPAAPGYPPGAPGYPQAAPGYPQAMPGMPPAANPYSDAQRRLAGAGGMLKIMRIGLAALGGLLVVGGVVVLITVDVMPGASMIISGVVVGAVGWFTLPKFMSQLGAASGMVNALHAQQQVAMTGIPMSARLVAMQQTGAMVNFNPQVQAVLEVQGPRGPYQVQTMAVVPQMSIPQFQPGAMVNVRVNPQNPHDVAVVF